MPLTVAGIAIDFDPGETYSHNGNTEQTRDEKRQAAVRQFQEAAGKTTRASLREAVAVVIALTIQLRAIGGSGAGTDMGGQLREAADFLEDL